MNGHFPSDIPPNLHYAAAETMRSLRFRFVCAALFVVLFLYFVILPLRFGRHTDDMQSVSFFGIIATAAFSLPL